ncbi:hypothetical protein KQX54_021611 [Cotesia glomerata]|uniref:Uncharacterized protein n=1 Tax=Cotesia glomerata TaxID=32391 RepID=A0AAV7J9W4_COTGL|nr:hypothetical protein KQX54_021611 [Cotesia glomerata]
MRNENEVRGEGWEEIEGETENTGQSQTRGRKLEESCEGDDDDDHSCRSSPSGGRPDVEAYFILLGGSYTLKYWKYLVIMLGDDNTF